MAEGARAWIESTPCQHAAAAAGPNPAGGIALQQLSPRHKRELASLTAAGLTSAAFFLVPLLIAAERPPLTAQPLAVLMPAPQASPSGIVLPVAVSRARAGRAEPRRQPHMLMAATNAAAATVSTAPAPLPERVLNPRKAPGRLTRALFGDGRYRVQPFPVLSDQD